MTDKVYSHVEHRKLVIELDIRIPETGRRHDKHRSERDREVAEAVRRELQRVSRGSA